MLKHNCHYQRFWAQVHRGRDNRRLNTIFGLRVQPQADMEEVCWIVVEHEAVAQDELLIRLVPIIGKRWAPLNRKEPSQSSSCWLSSLSVSFNDMYMTHPEVKTGCLRSLTLDLHISHWGLRLLQKAGCPALVMGMWVMKVNGSWPDAPVCQAMWRS